MFAPGFVTGRVIDRFGAIAILRACLMLNLLRVTVALPLPEMIILRMVLKPRPIVLSAWLPRAFSS